MNPSRTLAILCCGFTPLLATAAVVTPWAAAPRGESIVTRGDIGLRIEKVGRVESANRARLDWKPEVYGGEIRVAEVVRATGTVRAGEVILRLVAKDLDRELAEAIRQLDASKLRLNTSERERAISEENSALAVTRAMFAADVAARELKRWQTYEDAKALEMRALQVQGGEDRLVDEREELSQLEKLYSGAALDSQTKDIVLDRARRSLKRTERFTFFSTRDGAIYVAELHTDAARRVSDAARDTALDLAHAIINQELGLIRNKLTKEDADHGLQDAQRRVDQLQADKAALEIKAPFDGVLAMTPRERGDELSRGANICEVSDPSKLRIRVDLSADSLRLVDVGSDVMVSFPAMPDRSGLGRISQLAAVGTASGESTVFPAVIDLNSAGTLPPIGLDARVEVRGSIKNALIVPLKAVTTAPDGSKIVRRKRGDSIEEVHVRVGASDGTNVEIIDGLAPGDTLEVADG